MGREEQKEFVFCEVGKDDGLSGLAITGSFPRSPVVAEPKIVRIGPVVSVTWMWREPKPSIKKNLGQAEPSVR